jgi:hypothetical protein
LNPLDWLALTEGPNRMSPSPHLKMGTDPVFWLFRILKDEQSLETQPFLKSNVFKTEPKAQSFVNKSLTS